MDAVATERGVWYTRHAENKSNAGDADRAFKTGEGNA
jgi:hypothetical protein